MEKEKEKKQEQKQILADGVIITSCYSFSSR